MTQTRSASKRDYRLALGLTVFSILFLVWAVGALGIIGAGGEADRMYVAVVAVLLIGAAIARLRARAMALVLIATATTQVLVTLIALAAGMQDNEGASVIEILGINAMYVALFGLCAWLFDRAADQDGRSSHAPSGSRA